jgi:hypothetical protein
MLFKPLLPGGRTFQRSECLRDAETVPTSRHDAERAATRLGEACMVAFLDDARYRPKQAMGENFSLIVMCLFLLGSLAFLAQQLTSYH